MDASLPLPVTRLARPTASALSLALHAGLVAGAVLAARSVTSPPRERPVNPQIIFVEPAPIPPAQAPQPAQENPMSVASAPTGVSLSIDLPALPAVVVPGLAVDPVRGPAVAGPMRPVPLPVTGTAGGSGTPYGADRVDQQVRLLGALAVEYPVGLRRLGVTGRVEVEFVVDATGRVEPESIRWLAGAGSGFERGVREALRGARYAPARVHGVAVRQLVRQAFAFRIDR